MYTLSPYPPLFRCTPCWPRGPLCGARGFFFAAHACRRARMRPLIPIVIPAVSFLLVASVVLDPQGAAFAAGQEAAANATPAGAGPVAQAQSAPPNGQPLEAGVLADIGRAPCRARGCQYVYISWVGVY